MDAQLRQAIEHGIAECTGQPFRVADFLPRHGGCIHQSGIVSDGARRFFIKLNGGACADQFAAEADGLRALRDTATIRVPEVVGVLRAGDHAGLILEALDFAPSSPSDGWSELGRRLAALHRCAGARHGWPRDNFIGSTPQSNRSCACWAEFFIQQRLEPQFELGERHGMRFAQRGELIGRVRELLAGHHPAPSLLHGDLWSGNVAFLKSGQPVIFDPAVHHGDRECDLAFSEFFGGFPAAFYQAYGEFHPLDGGYPRRREIYNLYHVLNHANLFGGGYAEQAKSMIEAVCR